MRHLERREETGERQVFSLSGAGLGVEDIIAIGCGQKAVALGAAALERCLASRRFLEELVASGQVIYGVNTSFGPMCNKLVGSQQLEELQIGLIRSHAAGLGEPLRPEVALATLAVRLNSLLKGYSGVRLELLQMMQGMINAWIAPCMPECGSVGASGDLNHLAHLALAVIGEGEVFFRGRRCEAQETLVQAGLAPLRLSYKEGLALMNGTSAMTALAAFAISGARQLLRASCITAALAAEVFGGLDDAFDEDLHRAKPHPGQLRIVAAIRRLCEGSQNLTRRQALDYSLRNSRPQEPVCEATVSIQDAYSLRCTPQILAPVAEAIESAARTCETEMNSACDNPLIFGEERKVVHGGNFHGQSIAFSMDMLAIALATLCNLSERRLNRYLDRNLNCGLPEQLACGHPGLDTGLMGAQYLATSCTAENRQLANPVSTNSISCNGANQDVVSMGTIAARKVSRSVENAKHVLAVEAFAAFQALAFRNAAGLGRGTRRIYEAVRVHFRPYDGSRPFYQELAALRELLFNTPLLSEKVGRNA
jgi:histidine ammonia-lyase